MKKTTAKLWIGIAMLAVLSPIGIALPKLFKAGPAWGEWCASELGKLVGYVPQGVDKLAKPLWVPMSGYCIPGCETMWLGQVVFACIVSALIGIAVTVAIVFYLGKLLNKR